MVNENHRNKTRQGTENLFIEPTNPTNDKVIDIHTPTPPPTLPTLNPKVNQIPPKSNKNVINQTPAPTPSATPPHMLNPTPWTGVEEGKGVAGLKNAWKVLMDSKHRNGASPKNNSSRRTSNKKQHQPTSKVKAKSINQQHLGMKLNSSNLLDQPILKFFLEQNIKALSHNSF